MMDRVDDNPAMPIAEQAAEWLLRWHCGDLSIAERFEYLQWLKTSPVHIAETLRMCRLYSWLEGTKLKLYITNEDSYSNVVELPPRECAARRTAQRTSAWRGRLAAGIAAIGLTALLGFVIKVGWLDHTIQTQVSEWRSLSLTDGSVVSAGPHTRLRHDIGAEQRLIRLAQGEAMFKVAKDPSRPFLVDAGLAIVKVTGTEFSVDRRGDEVIVSVREGSVLVMPKPANAAKLENVPLVKAQRVAVSSSGITPVHPIDVERAFAWADRRLIFESDRVSEAVEEFNRRNQLQISVDPALGARELRGWFEAHDPQSFVDFLVHHNSGVVVERQPGTVHIKLPNEASR